MDVEQTAVILKGHIMADGTYPDIIEMIRNSGLKITAVRAMASPCQPKTAEHAMFTAVAEPLEGSEQALESMTNPVGGMMLLLEGENAVSRMLLLAGDNWARHVKPGTIRARFGRNRFENAVHVSGSQAEAEREIAIMFPPIPDRPRLDPPNDHVWQSQVLSEPRPLVDPADIDAPEPADA